MTADHFFHNVQDWAARHPQIDSVLLVGSYARGANHTGSDADLVILTAAKAALLRDRSWTAQFGSVQQEQIEEYGACTSIRVWYEDGLEAEFGLVLPSWAELPLDAGTARVLRDGYLVLADRAGHFAAPEIPPLRQPGSSPVSDITYCDTKKDLPSEQLHRLFRSAGWTKDEPDTPETQDRTAHFNAPFLRSALVVSAWDGERLVGVVRVLSDGVIRSVVYDLIVDPAYQSQGIGKTLLARCLAHFPGTEWLVGTTEDIAGYYEKLGFRRFSDVFLHIPSRYQ